jgi:hypothetical protein
MPDTRWPPSSVLLTISVILLVSLGIYFILIRPPLLSEDIRYMSLTPSELQSIGPRLASWLTHVFRVMGGYIAATGVLALTLVWTSFHGYRPVAVAGVGIADALSIGLMAAVNFMIHSDFKWVLFVREASGHAGAAVTPNAAPQPASTPRR